MTISTLRPRHLALDLLRDTTEALDHLLAARRDDAGERRQQADLDRRPPVRAPMARHADDAAAARAAVVVFRKLPAVHARCPFRSESMFDLTHLARHDGAQLADDALGGEDHDEDEHEARAPSASARYRR